MGTISAAGIILNEAFESGARIIWRGGSAGSTIEDSELGQAIVVDYAFGWDAASLLWKPASFCSQALMALAMHDWFNPALISTADPNLVRIVSTVAEEIAAGNYHVAPEATTADFNHEQGRPGLTPIPDHLAERHELVLRGTIGAYSMEAAGIYTAAVNKLPLKVPSIAVEAIYAQRHKGTFADEAMCAKGDELVLDIFLESVPRIIRDPAFAQILAT